MKVLSVRFSRKRKAEYSIRTEIVEVADKLIVRKIAMSDKAVPFVNGMELNYRQMVGMYGKEHVAEGWLEKDGIFCMEFIEGISMEQQVMNYFCQSDYNSFIDVISYWYSNILPNDIEEAPNSKYINPLAHNRKYNIDLTLSNIMLPRDGQFKIIDYEWLFPMGSKELIGARAMQNLHAKNKPYFDRVKMQQEHLVVGLGIDTSRFALINAKEEQFSTMLMEDSDTCTKKQKINVSL